MSDDSLSVLVVDDSALMRNLISRIIEDAPGLSVAARAINGAFALQKIERQHVDVVVLDLEMPQMNGIEFLRERRRRAIDIPVVVLSSVAQKGARITMEAIGLGASDFLLKPSESNSEDIRTIATQLVEMVRGYGAEYRRRRSRSNAGSSLATAAPREAPRASPQRPIAREPAVTAPWGPPAARSEPAGDGGVIAIGISTGGPTALRKVLAAFDDDLPLPVVIVQHMPAGFTTEFARSLDRVCPLEVKEAEHGDLLRPGRVLIAPGNRHVTVERRALSGVVQLSDGAARNGHRPSVDILFASVAEQYGSDALGVIMTGMGRDGAAELGSILRRGGTTIGQDAASCVVYGMPKAAFEMGHVQLQVPLHRMAETLYRLAREKRG